jgi:hypothetical protein
MGLDNDDIKALIAILQKGLANDETPEPKTSTKKIKSVPKRKNKTVNDHDGTNLFDTMSDRNLHKEDIEFDRAVRKFPPTPRNRSFTPVTVVCRSCGKKEEVNPVLIHDSVDRYKCNKCSSSAG